MGAVTVTGGLTRSSEALLTLGISEAVLNLAAAFLLPIPIY